MLLVGGGPRRSRAHVIGARRRGSMLLDGGSSERADAGTGLSGKTASAQRHADSDAEGERPRRRSASAARPPRHSPTHPPTLEDLSDLSGARVGEDVSPDASASLQDRMASPDRTASRGGLAERQRALRAGCPKIQKKTVSGMGKNRGRVTGGVCERWRRMIGECEL